MKYPSQSVTILIAEDDPDDCLLMEEVFRESGQGYNLVFVQDGVELFQYLRHQASYATSPSPRRPDLILLDLNMPRMDGLEALAEIKTDPNLRSIPVVVLTVSSTEEYILRTYELGGAGFIIKPANIDDMLNVVKVLIQYWFEVVELANGEVIRKIKHGDTAWHSSGESISD
jgi:CheY-like chemotaxis protein